MDTTIWWVISHIEFIWSNLQIEDEMIQCIICEDWYHSRVSFGFIFGSWLGPLLSTNPEEGDHVYFAHPTTNVLVVISTNTQPMYRSMYRPSVDQYVGRHIGQVPVNQDVSVIYRPTYRSTLGRFVGRYVGRYVDQEWLFDCRLTCQSIGYWHFTDTSLLLAYWLL